MSNKKRTKPIVLSVCNYAIYIPSNHQCPVQVLVNPCANVVANNCSTQLLVASCYIIPATPRSPADPTAEGRQQIADSGQRAVDTNSPGTSVILFDRVAALNTKRPAPLFVLMPRFLAAKLPPQNAHFPTAGLIKTSQYWVYECPREYVQSFSTKVVSLKIFLFILFHDLLYNFAK